MESTAEPAPLAFRRSDFPSASLPPTVSSRLAEAEPRLPAVVGGADDDVIEKADLEQPRGFGEADGEAAIGIARRRDRRRDDCGRR